MYISSVCLNSKHKSRAHKNRRVADGDFLAGLMVGGGGNNNGVGKGRSKGVSEDSFRIWKMWENVWANPMCHARSDVR